METRCHGIYLVLGQRPRHEIQDLTNEIKEILATSQSVVLHTVSFACDEADVSEAPLQYHATNDNRSPHLVLALKHCLL